MTEGTTDKINVKASHGLYKSWHELSKKVQNLAAIVQNDMDVNPDEVVKWEALATQTEREIKDLAIRTSDHVWGTSEEKG